jgi:beta-N-acetylhexosaminidase
MAGKREFVERLLNRMTLEEKVGGCITFEFCGTRVDSHVYDKVLRHQCAGLRITPHIYTEEPYGNRLLTGGEVIQRTSPYAGLREYATILNRVQEIALSRRLHIPLHFSSDQEGDYSQDVARGGVNLFPSQMGMTATGSDRLVYQAYRAIARQQRAAGVRMLHTPVLDVNIEPENPEICTRSFGDDPAVVSRMGKLLLQAFRAEGIVATGKHFPGRGNSKVDVHFKLDVNPGTARQLWQVDLAPYVALIQAGLPAVMTAHTIYPALDPQRRPASVSRAITTDLLRGRLGFRGVITTDAMGMKGVSALFSGIGESCAEAIAAGADLVLAKVDASLRDDVYDWILKYVRDGRIPLAELDAHNRRVLSMKWDYGMFRQPLADPDAAEKVTRNRKVIALSQQVAARASLLLRDRAKLLPLAKDAPVLVTQQRCDLYHNKSHDFWFRPNMLQEFVRKHAKTVYDYETQLEVTKEDVKNVLRLAKKVKVVIVLGAFWRSLPTNAALIRKLLKAGKRVVVVTNTPYELSCPREAQTVLLTFSTMPRSLEHAAAVLYGRAKCRGRWPLRRLRAPR